MKILLEKFECKIKIWGFFYTNLKYCEFIKIGKFEISFYNEILLNEIRKKNKWLGNTIFRKKILKVIEKIRK